MISFSKTHNFILGLTLENPVDATPGGESDAAEHREPAISKLKLNVDRN